MCLLGEVSLLRLLMLADGTEFSCCLKIGRSWFQWTVTLSGWRSSTIRGGSA